MKLVRRLLRVLGYTLLVFIALAVGAIGVFTLTGKGRENLAALVSSMASSDESKVRIGGVSGIWSGPTKIDHVVLEDARGPWLVIRGAEVEWSLLPLLFSSTFRADKVSAARIEMARLPQPGARSEGGAGLPVSLDIKAFDLPEIALGREIAGGIAQLAAHGSVEAATSPLNVVTNVTLARSDGTAGDLDAQVHFAPAEDKLDIDIRLSEPAGGVLANFLRLPGAPPVQLLVSGSGPAANWKGTGTFAVDGKVVTTIAGAHRATDRGNLIEAKGDGAFEQFLPENLRPLLAGPTTFDIVATALQAGGVDVERATLTSAALTATVAGAVDPEGGADLSLDAKAVGDPVRIAFGEGAGEVAIALRSATARAFGDGAQPMIDVTASLAEVVAGGNRLAEVEATGHSDGFDLASRSGPFSVDIKAGAATVENQNLAPLLAGALELTGAGIVDANTVTIEAASLKTEAASASLGGTVGMADGTLALTVEADVAADALPAATRATLGERVAIAGAVKRDAAGALAADDLKVSSGPLTVTGSASLAGDVVDARLEGALADLGRLAEGTAGAATFRISAAGPMAAPELSLTVASDRLETAGREISGLELTATGVADIDRPSADVTLKGTVAGEALAGTATLRTEEGRREINDLSLALGENRVSGDLVLDAAFIPIGTVEFTLPDVGPLAALALDTAEGDLRGSVRFAREGTVPTVTLDASTAGLKRGDLTASDVVVAATVKNYLVAPAISGSVKAGGLTTGGTTISKVDVALTQDGPWTGFSGGATVNDLPAQAAGRARFADGAVTIELTAASAVVRGLEPTLSRATTIVIKGGETTLDKLALGIGGGTVTLSGTAGEKLNLDIQLGGVSAGVINAFAPGVGAAGSITGNARVAGDPARPDVGYQLDWKGAETAQTRSAGFGAMAIVSSGELVGGLLKFDASLGDGSGLVLKGGGSVNTGGSRALALDFSGTVPFGFLTRRLAAQGLSLSGAANVSLQVRGPAASPAVGGTISASGARFVDARSGIAVDDIAADIALGGGLATVRRMTGKLSTGGALSASGTIGIDAAKGFPADLALKIADGRYTDGRIVTATLSGDLTLKGPLASAPLVGGTVNLGRTVITVPERLPGSLATLDVKHRNAPKAVRAQEEAIRPATAGGGGGGLALDLTVNAPQQIFVQGRGLDAELGGSLRLTGPSAAPQATGQFTMRRGRFSLLGKRLSFSRGSLSFSGSLVPYLDLAAESSANDATVTVLVTGPANNPKFSFSSVPLLPEDEVLARLVFGRSMSRLSPIQIAQLADAAAQLAGVGGSSSLLDALRGKIGIDDLDVKTDEKTGDTAVSAGKYLNDRTYVTIEKGQKSGDGKATIDLNIGRGVKLRGEAGEDGKAKGGIFYEREY